MNIYWKGGKDMKRHEKTRYCALSHPNENSCLAAAPLVRPPFSGTAAVSLSDPARLSWQAQWQLHKHNKQQPNIALIKCSTITNLQPSVHCSPEIPFHNASCPSFVWSGTPPRLPAKQGATRTSEQMQETMHKKSNKCKRMQKDAKGGVESREKMTKLSDKTVRKKDLKQEGIIHVGGESS